MTAMLRDEAIHRDLEAIMPSLARLMAQSLECDRTSIFVYDDDETATIARYRYGFNGKLLERNDWTETASPWEFPLEAEVLRTRRAIQRNTPEDFARFPLAFPSHPRDEGRDCDLGVPLIWEDRIFGIAYVWNSNSRRPFSDADVQKALNIAQLAAIAIASARQYASARSHRSQLDALVRSSNLVTSAVDIDTVVPLLAQSLQQALGVDVCCLYVFDEMARQVLLADAAGLKETEQDLVARSLAPAVGEVPVEVRMQETLAPQIVQDFANEFAAESPIAKYAEEADIFEILAVPIAYRDSLIGVVYSWNRGQVDRFSSEQIEMAKAISNHLAGVIARVRLDEQSRRERQETEALQRVGESVLTSDSLDPVLDEIIDVLRNSIEFDDAFIAFGETTSDVQIIRRWNKQSEITGHSSATAYRGPSDKVFAFHEVTIATDRSQIEHSWFDKELGPDTNSVLAVPLEFASPSAGVIVLGSETEGQFNIKDVRLLTLLAQQASLVIQRINARQKLERTASRQSFLASVVELLVVGEDPETVLPEIAKRASGVVADGIAIGVSGWKYGEIRWAAVSHQNNQRELQLRLELERLDTAPLRDPIERVLVEGREFAFGPDGVREDHQVFRTFLESLKIRHVLVLPLVHEARGKGVMLLFSHADHGAFDPEEVEIARVLTRRIADAIERKQLARNREALLHVSELMHSQTSIADLTDTLTRELRDVLPFDQVFLGTTSPGDRAVNGLYYRDHEGNLRTDLRLPVEVGICGEALRRGQPIWDNYADQRMSTYYTSPEEREYFQLHGESAMVTPLISDLEVIGLLFIGRTGHQRFTAADFETFMLFSGLAAAALDRTSLVQRNRELYRASVEVLAAVVDAKDPTTLQHSRNVAHYSKLIAELLELPAEEVQRIELAGLMHDIGKLGVPDRVLQKPRKLKADELELIRAHPDRGARILEQHPALAALVPLVRHHHERFDGQGYPDALHGDDIPIGACIIGVADTFDTITSDRTYQQRRPIIDALDELERCGSTQFHPRVVNAFVNAARSNHQLLKIPEGDGDLLAIRKL